MHDKRGGAYLSHSYPNRKLSIIGLMVLIVVIAFATLIGGGGDREHRITYHLPDEVPIFGLSEDPEDHSGSRDLDELVIPYYDFLLEAGDNTIEVSLPAIQASYGTEFNTAVVKQLETLVSNTMFYFERGESWVIKKLSYEAYLDQDILTILIMTETDDQVRCEPWIFDLTDDGRLIGTSGLVERLLELDYATFLYITDQYIQDDFSKTYYDQAYTIDGPSEHVANYRGILREIPRDIASAFSRWIFPAEGNVYMVYELPLISADWYTGFRTITKIVEIDASILRYKDMVTPKEAVLDAVFNSTVHVMGATDQAHALLVRTVFYCAPDVFVDAVGGVSKQDQTYAIESLLRYADETDLNQILEVYNECAESLDQPEAASEVINRIIAEIKNKS